MKKLLALFLAFSMIFSSVAAIAEIDINIDFGDDRTVAGTVYAWDGVSYSLDWLATGNPEGTAGDKFYLNSAEDLAGLAYYVNTYSSTNNIFTGDTVYLNVDVDLANYDWDPIGTAIPKEKNRFYGSFNGQNHTISNLKVRKNAHSFAGLFGTVPTYNFSQTFSNVTLNNVQVHSLDGKSGSEAAGALIARANGAVIDNCHVTGSIDVRGDRFVGGLVGHSYARISNSSVKGTGKIYCATWQVGGLAGVQRKYDPSQCDASWIKNCSVEGIDGKLVVESGYYGPAGGITSYVVSDVGPVEDVIMDGNIVKNVDVRAYTTYDGLSTAYISNTGNLTNSLAINVSTYINGNKITGVDSNVCAVAEINGDFYTSVSAALNTAVEGDTIYLSGSINEGTIKLPANLKNVTLDGQGVATLVNTTLSAADDNSYNYENLTIKGITFDNSRILLTGWRNGDELIKNLVITDNVFKNLYYTTNTAALHINKDGAEAVQGLTFTNNVIECAKGGQKSGIYAQATGEVIIKNNVINNVSFRPFVMQITTDDGIADNFVVEGNTFSGSAAGRLQGLGNNAAGTDNVNLVITDNIIENVPDAQEICYWNFNPATTTTNFAYNYFGADIIAAPSNIYYNASASNAKALLDMGIFPFYTALNEDGTINKASINTGAAYGDAKIGDVIYSTTQKAVEAAVEVAAETQAPVTVTVTANIPTKLVFGSPVSTFSLNNATDLVTVDLGGYVAEQGVEVNSGNVKLINGTIKNEIVVNGGGLVLEDITVDATLTVNAGTVEIISGSYSFDPTAYVVAGKKAIVDTYGWYTIVEAATKDNSIAVVFEEVDTVEGEALYNINVVNADGINRLNSADLTFKFVPAAVNGGAMVYEILEKEGSKISVSQHPTDADRYLFNYDTKEGVVDTAAKITIGQVKVTGYGKFTLAIVEDTNEVHATTVNDNIVDTFIPNGAALGKGTLVLPTAPLAGEIKVPTRTLTIQIAFPNAIKGNVKAYQDMKVTIEGNFGGVEATKTYDLGALDTNNGYVVTEKDLVLNNAYNVTVSGAGYRTARYTVTMTEAKTLNFWNNVKTTPEVIEVGKTTGAVAVTFLAGDIVKDNQINIYDLSAVVSYFGTINVTDAKSDYAKYDLNRDGKIDSKDVAYVLVSWKK